MRMFAAHWCARSGRSRARSLLGAVAAACVAVAATVPATAFAQGAFPNKPIRIVVPFPPGGAGDALPRLVSERATAIIGQPFIVENRPGAGGNIGAEIVFRAEPDGYTLLVTPPNIVTVNALLYPKLAFDPGTLTPVSIMATYPNVLLASPKAPFNTFAEMIAFARANPGRLNIASQGSGTSTHLTAELFKSMGGVQLVHVPYKGSGPALTDLMASQVDLMFDNLVVTLQNVRAGKLKLLAVGGAKRAPQVPDVPAIAETLPGFNSVTWMGFVAPPRTPAAVVERLSSAFAEAVRDPGVTKRITDLNVEPYGSTAAQMGELIRQDREYWTKVIREASVKVD